MKKVSVSSIMLNESPEFIERWTKSALDADEVVLVDTGSTNDAVECARDLGVVVHEIAIRPWRFDVARNAALALLPADIDLVVKVDVDEVLVPGWRDVIEDAPPADRYSYRYVWNFDADGNPDVEFSADHTHTRFNWQWRHPCHEALHFTGEGKPLTLHLPFTIEHHADNTKSRGQYLDLLAQAVREAPEDDRMAHYYARELFFRGDWARARVEFLRHLALPTSTWAAERCQSYRYIAKMDDHPERWLLKAAAEDPSRREAWVDLADLHHAHGELDIASGFAARALGIKTRGLDYMSDASAWDDERLLRILNPR